MKNRKPKIVIYGCGQYGGYIARLAVQMGWSIAAAFNRAGPKVGQDLGHAIGLGRDLGVIIQDSETGDFEGLEADIGIVTQTNLLRTNLPAYRKLMTAGLNVGCHGSESYYPFGSDPEAATEIDALAKKNGVTFTGSGIWDMSRIWSGILLLGPCTEVRSLRHSSITDVQGQMATKAQALQVGVGMSVEQFAVSGLPQARTLLSYKTIPEQVLAASGYTVCQSHAQIEPILSQTPLESALMETIYPRGICIGTRIAIDVQTLEGISATAQIDLRLLREGEVEHMFWEVDGKPRTRVRVERDDSAHATAASLFNRIPDIIAARPGIVVVSQLGPMRPISSRFD